MKVRELIAALQKMDPDVQVACFSRWCPSDKEGGDSWPSAEVVNQVVLCELPYRGTPEAPLKIVRVACLNPSFRTLDYVERGKAQ